MNHDQPLYQICAKILLLIALCPISISHADPPSPKLLRQITLDLYQRIPSLQEQVDWQKSSTDQINTLIQQKLDQNDEWFSFVYRFFADLFWPAVKTEYLFNPAINILIPASIIESGIYRSDDRLFSFFTAFYHRKAFVPCLDEEAEFDDQGHVVLKPLSDGTLRDGYVYVYPYWNPEQEIKVCALEAQHFTQSPSTNISCDRVEGFVMGDCGCGDQLKRCASYESAMQITQAFSAQYQEVLREYLSKDQIQASSFFEIFTQNREPVNGMIAFYYQNLAKYAIDPTILESPIVAEELNALNLSFQDQTWHWVSQKSELSSGILTSFPFLTRFQTSRARANRISTQLLCEPFIAVGTEIPPANDPCSQEPNLRQRCGCKDCHQRLEPLASYFGRFSNAGTLYLDPIKYPSYMERCLNCALHQNCDDFCKKFYTVEAKTEAQKSYLGILKSYEWGNDEDFDHIEQGPKAWIEKEISNDKLSFCLTRKLYERLVNREMLSAERTMIKDLAKDFKENQYSLKFLIKEILKSKVYLGEPQ